MADTTSQEQEILETETVGQTEAPEVDPAEQGEDPEEAGLSEDARRARWQARRPRIDHLKPAVISTPGDLDPSTGLQANDVLVLFDVGDRIVVDCRTPILTGAPWLQTIVGKVRSIDDDTGLVSIYDEDSDPRNPMVRWVTFKDEYHDFRLAPAKGNPFNAEKIKAVRPPPAPGEERRGRGRPKGSKNRPKEEINAEREAYKKLRDERKGRRK